MIKNILLLLYLASSCGGRTDNYVQNCSLGYLCPLGTYCASDGSCDSCFNSPTGKCDDSDCYLTTDGSNIIVCPGTTNTCDNINDVLRVSSKICELTIYCKSSYQCMVVGDAGIFSTQLKQDCKTVCNIVSGICGNTQINCNASCTSYKGDITQINEYEELLNCTAQNLTLGPDYVCASSGSLNSWSYGSTACDAQLCIWTCGDI